MSDLERTYDETATRASMLENASRLLGTAAKLISGVPELSAARNILLTVNMDMVLPKWEELEENASNLWNKMMEERT